MRQNVDDTEVTAIPNPCDHEPDADSSALEAVSPLESSTRATEIESNHSILPSYDRTASKESEAINIITLPTEAKGTNSNKGSGASPSPIVTWDDEL
jgi:hypothetical protein